MEKSRSKKTILFLCIIFLISVGAFFLYYFVTGKQNPFLKFVGNGSHEEKIEDNYNGIYSNYEELNGSKFIFSGCSISRIANYILVVDDEYYMYRSTCMGTYGKGKGKTEELEIKLDEEKKSFYIYKDDKTYDKDILVNTVNLHNKIEELHLIDLSTYQIFMRETQFEGNYYNLEKMAINNSSSGMLMNIIRNSETGVFSLTFNPDMMHDKQVIFQKDVSDFNYLPYFYTYGNSIAMVEVEKNANDKSKYANNFVVFNKTGIIYTLKDKFPIVIDGVTLNTENSIYIKFNPAKRYFTMLVGHDDKMCDLDYDGKGSDDIMYYEFSIEYDYKSNNFLEPKFQKIGRKSEGCRYVNSIMGD